jgi:hypothetical protein
MRGNAVGTAIAQISGEIDQVFKGYSSKILIKSTKVY